MSYRTLFDGVIILFLVFIIVPITGEGFIAGTLIKTPQGYIAIEKLNSGDPLFCCDESGEIFISTITATQKNISSQLITITTDTASITTDSQQLFYHAPKEMWTQANMLTLSDPLFSCSYGILPIHAIDYSHNSITTYSLSVKDYHNFFISEHDILVHNMAILVATPVATPIITNALVIATAKTVATLSIFGSCMYAFFCNRTSQKNNNNNHHHPPHNNQDNPCLCGHSCTFGCNCNCTCNCGEKNSLIKNLHDILKKTKPGNETKGKTEQFIKLGGYDQALADFYTLNPTNIKDLNNGKIGKIGKLADGRTINVRIESTEESPTLEIYNPFNSRAIKIRYK